MRVCQNKCESYKAKRKMGHMYNGTNGYCSICSKYIMFEGRDCPCCKTCLRRRTRGHSSFRQTGKEKRY